jgi:hypothetical protein
VCGRVGVREEGFAKGSRRLLEEEGRGDGGSVA